MHIVLLMSFTRTVNRDKTFFSFSSSQKIIAIDEVSYKRKETQRRRND